MGGEVGWGELGDYITHNSPGLTDLKWQSSPSASTSNNFIQTGSYQDHSNNLPTAASHLYVEYGNRPQVGRFRPFTPQKKMFQNGQPCFRMT